MCLKLFRYSAGWRRGARTVPPPGFTWWAKHWSDDDQLSYPGGVAGAIDCGTAQKPGG
jgi:hypothetical protein